MHSYTLVLILPLIDTKLRFLFLFLGVTMGYPCMEVFPWVSCETDQNRILSKYVQGGDLPSH